MSRKLVALIFSLFLFYETFIVNEKMPKEEDLADFRKIRGRIEWTAVVSKSYEFKCQSAIIDREGRERYEYCFVHFNDEGKFEETENYIPGSYVTKMEKKNNFIESIIHMPPFFFNTKKILCECYTEVPGERAVWLNTLHIQINQTQNLTGGGCDFNPSHVYPTKAIDRFQKVDPDKVPVCNIYDVKANDDLMIICPQNYTVSPATCFKEKVYVYKKNVFSNDTIKNEDYEEASVQNLLGITPTISGNKRIIFTKLSGLSADNKVSFFCTCNGNSSTIVRMNVHANLSLEEVKKKGEIMDANNYSNNSYINLTYLLVAILLNFMSYMFI